MRPRKASTRRVIVRYECDTASNGSWLDMPTAAGLRSMRICCIVAVAVIVCVLRLGETVQGEQYETSLSSPMSIFLASPTPVRNSNPLVTISLTFTVSVCLADVEYSIACRERGLSEAAKRLEQIYLDIYATRRAAGSLKVWFTLPTQQSEQLRFLREAEERAIKTVAAKLQTEGNQGINSQLNWPGTNSLETSRPEEQGEPNRSVQGHAQQVQKWREDAMQEARKGTNWSHDWPSRTHSYQLGQALRDLVQIANRAHSAR